MSFGAERKTTSKGVRAEYQGKPLREWAKDDVDNWVKDNFSDLVYKGKASKDVSILQGLTGNDLSTITEEKLQGLIRDHVLNLKTLTPEALALVTPLYLALQDLRQPLSTHIFLSRSFFFPFTFLFPLITYIFLCPPSLSVHMPPVERLDPAVRASLQHFERWSHLQASNLDNLKVGDLIELPDLGERPKELGNERHKNPLKKVLMTKERLDHIKEVARELDFGKEDYSENQGERGRILSGPNGIGKTVLSYQTAAFAWANGAIVLYIVSIANFLQASSNSLILFPF